MVTDLVLESILKNLTFDQIKVLQCNNRRIRDTIRRNRLKFPRWKCDYVELKFSENEVVINFFDYFEYSTSNYECMKKTGNESTIDLSSETDTVMRTLQHVETKKLLIEGDPIDSILDNKWLKSIEEIRIRNMGDTDWIVPFLRKTSCHSFIALDASYSLNADAIINEMDSVRKLSIENARFSNDFMPTLIRKSNNGDGLEVITLKGNRSCPVEIDQIIDLCKGARLARKTFVCFGFVNGTRFEFRRKRQAFTDSGDDRSMKIYEDITFLLHIFMKILR